jgi:hypothetical protein
MMKGICILAPNYLVRSHFGAKIQKENETQKESMVFRQKVISLWVSDFCLHIKETKKKPTRKKSNRMTKKTIFFLFIGKLHTPNGTRDLTILTLHLAATRGGGIV